MRQVEERRRGDGTTSYVVRFRYGTSRKTGKPLQTSERFDTRRQAQQFAVWLDALGPQGALDQLFAGEQAADVPSLDQLAADHIEHLTGIEQGTRDEYRRLWRRSWGPLIGKYPANLLTRDHVAKAVNDLSARYSRKSLQNQRGLLAAVCGRAVDLGYLPRNPTKGMRLPRTGEVEADDMVLLTPDTFAELLERVPEHYRPFVRFLAGTGARWGEAVALQCGDVLPSAVRLRRARKWGTGQIGPTKTRKGNRTVTVPREVALDLALLCYSRAKSELVFTTVLGRPILHGNFRDKVWLPAVKGMDPRPRIHDLRHSHASWLLGAGVPIHVVQARLGHESITTTVDTYSHLMPDAQLLAAQAADHVFAPAPVLGELEP